MTTPYPLGRNEEHDLRSLNYRLDTSNLTIKSVEHARYIPILDQGNISSCVAESSIGHLSSLPFADKDNTYYERNQVGAIKLYSDLQIQEGFGPFPPNDNGSSGVTAARVLLKKGLISGFQHTFSLQDALKAGSVYPWITGVMWYTAMFYPDADGRAHPQGNKEGGHEIQLKSIDVEKGILWFYNSWGTKYGVDGCFYLTWSDFNFLLSQGGDVTVLFPVSETPPVPAPRILKRTRPLMHGDDVKVVQQELVDLGYLHDKVDGYFGERSKQAVIQFQIANKLIPDGVVGTNTYNALEAAKKKQ